MYHLYYDKYPGNRNCEDELIEIKGFVDGLWRYTQLGTIHNFMSFMGIEYKWTNDINHPNIVVIVEIDSQNEESFFNIVKYVSLKYKKVIVLTTTEPLTYSLDFENLKNEFPNVFIIMNGDHLLEEMPENIRLFPFFILRPISIETNLKVHSIKNCNNIIHNKPYIFNHLSKNWTLEKYHMHYTIKNYFNNLNTALLSYKPPNFYKTDRGDFSLQAVKTTKWMHKLKCQHSAEFNNFYPYDDYINKIDVYGEEIILNDPLINDVTLGSFRLEHPLEIYLNSHISIISEIPNSIVLINDKMNPFYGKKQIISNNISEKTIQPILNNHIFIVNHPNNYNTNYLKNKLGFEIFEELFDYEIIENDDMIQNHFTNDCTLFSYNIIQQMNTFDINNIRDNAKTICEKIYYNKDLLTNPNSNLRLSLKNKFTEILDLYLDMNV